MTTIQKDFIKGNWITVANLVLLIGIIIQQARWQQTVDNRLQQLEVHTQDKTQHMPFEEKIQVFVPRVEIDGRLRNIENSLIEIKQDLKKNLEK